jgi:hypothetical protein
MVQIEWNMTMANCSSTITAQLHEFFDLSQGGNSCTASGAVRLADVCGVHRAPEVTHESLLRHIARA